jgi:hypothetical protein
MWSLLGWDDDCEGSKKTIMRKEEWKDCKAQNDAIQWGATTTGTSWEVTPPMSLVSQGDIPRFRPWGLTAKQVAQGGMWPTEEKQYADREHLAGRVPIEVSVEVHPSVGDLAGEHTACRCFLVFVLIWLST